MTYKDALNHLSRHTIEAVTGADDSTVRRWRREPSRVSTGYRRLLTLAASGRVLPESEPWLHCDLDTHTLWVDGMDKPIDDWRTLYWELQRFQEREQALKRAGWRLPPLLAPAPVYSVYRLDEDAGDLWQLEAAADGRAFGKPERGRAWRGVVSEAGSSQNDRAVGE